MYAFLYCGFVVIWLVGNVRERVALGLHCKTCGRELLCPEFWSWIVILALESTLFLYFLHSYQIFLLLFFCSFLSSLHSRFALLTFFSIPVFLASDDFWWWYRWTWLVRLLKVYYTATIGLRFCGDSIHAVL